MKLSHLFSKTTKDVSSDEVSKNAQLLIKAGYIDKLTAGVYSYLPLGLRVLNNIAEIVREEMNQIGGQEVLMPALQPKQIWEQTKRWDKVDVLFKTQSRWGNHEYGIGPTHEEVVTPLVKKFVSSYKDLPVAVYQIQNKFRDEPRAKSGLLRGREFLMKDLYSFHTSEEDRSEYYKKAIEAYKNIFKRCGFSKVLVTEASGGSFSDKFSHEFQIITPAGEDITFYCDDCGWAQNEEIAKVKEGDTCPGCSKGNIEKAKTIEAGNIFDLGKKFAEDFKLYFQNENGEQQPVIMGCYGIGISRLMGSVVEDLSDDKGLVWPMSVAPYHAHLVVLGNDEEVNKQAQEAYQELQSAGIDVIFDDRDASIGDKLNDADMLGMPFRLIISKKTDGKVEIKERVSEEVNVVELSQAIDTIKSKL